MSGQDPEKRSSGDSDHGGHKDVFVTDEDEVLDGSTSGLKRQLKSRHMAMISLGAVIGTGLFVGTASSLKSGGPIGLLLGYIVMGSVCYSVMVSLGEMIALYPVAGGHVRLAAMFSNQSLSLAMGWISWYNCAIILPAELSAAAVLLNYWNNTVNDAVWITMCLVVVVGINMLGAGVYGECEFIFASLKIITIVGLIILGIVIDLGGGPSHDRIGFRYWKDPGPFVQYNGISGTKGRFLGWGAVMTQAAFSFVGTEIVAIAAGEARDPRKNIPKAIKRVYIRILVFYIGGVLIIGLLVPSNHPSLNLTNRDAAASPFVIAIEQAGITGLSSVINAAVLTSAWSAATSDLYTSSRYLYGLSISGNAPKVFSRTTKRGLPWVSLSLGAALALLSYMNVAAGSGRVFGWFANMCSIAGLMSWFGISFTYLRFYAGMKAQGIDRRTLPYRSPLQPFLAWYAIVSVTVFSLFSGFPIFLKGGWATDTFVTFYLPLALFPAMYALGRFVIYRKALVPLSEMDFNSGLVQVEEDRRNEKPTTTAMARLGQRLRAAFL